MLDALETTPFSTLVVCLSLLFLPPLFVFRIYLPCVQCYDFEVRQR